MNSQPPRRDYSTYALGGHVLLAVVSGVVYTAFVLALGLYVAAVLRAILSRARA